LSVILPSLGWSFSNALEIAVIHAEATEGGRVGGVRVPVHHPSGSVEQRAELDPHDPAPIPTRLRVSDALALLAHLVFGPSLPALRRPVVAVRVEQLDTQAVAEVDEAGLGQELLGPSLMAPQEPTQAGTFRQV
jgi:hypothetical protein